MEGHGRHRGLVSRSQWAGAGAVVGRGAAALTEPGLLIPLHLDGEAEVRQLHRCPFALAGQEQVLRLCGHRAQGAPGMDSTGHRHEWGERGGTGQVEGLYRCRQLGPACQPALRRGHECPLPMAQGARWHSLMASSGSSHVSLASSQHPPPSPCIPPSLRVPPIISLCPAVTHHPPPAKLQLLPPPSPHPSQFTLPLGQW